ncbi:histidine phosphatase family protein [Consotaella aegiceratis]|uniref:histidine phosphatase family protein n=1 Tax=Consotaella aegiceratis TaxID=3097961 RepID=UPI002F3F65A2
MALSLGNLPLLYLSRHGQTSWNAEERIQGQRDIPLNEIGRAQAKRNGRRLAEVLGAGAKDLYFLASPLSRACETMRLIRTELGLPPADFETDARLKEIHFGDWQGSTIKELAVVDAAAVEEREANKWHYVPPGDDAESYEALAARVAPVFEGLDRPSLIVAHGGVMRAFFKLYEGVAVNHAAHAQIPQDQVLRVADNRAEWI